MSDTAVAQLPASVVRDQLCQLIHLLTLFMVPLDHLEALVSFEEQRKLENPNPMLHAVRKSLRLMESALLSTPGISRLAPSGRVPFVTREHAVFVAPSKASLQADGAERVVETTIRAGYRHDATGAILRRALVALAPAPLAAPPSPSPAGTEALGQAASEVEELVHELLGSDTLQGLAVRFGVQPGALLRLNRLPSAQALHGRRQVPPTTCYDPGHSYGG